MNCRMQKLYLYTPELLNNKSSLFPCFVKSQKFQLEAQVVCGFSLEISDDYSSLFCTIHILFCMASMIIFCMISVDRTMRSKVFLVGRLWTKFKTDRQKTDRQKTDRFKEYRCTVIETDIWKTIEQKYTGDRKTMERQKADGQKMIEDGQKEDRKDRWSCRQMDKQTD